MNSRYCRIALLTWALLASGYAGAQPQGCSAQEWATLQQISARAQQALLAGDFNAYLRELQGAQQAISHSCQAALAQAQQQPQCTPQEQQLLGQYAAAMMQAMQRNDIQRYIQLAQQMGGAVSPSCQALLAKSQQNYPRPGSYGSPPSGSGSVIDHGGGVYTVPGAATCGPSGCISY